MSRPRDFSFYFIFSSLRSTSRRPPLAPSVCSIRRRKKGRRKKRGRGWHEKAKTRCEKKRKTSQTGLLLFRLRNGALLLGGVDWCASSHAAPDSWKPRRSLETSAIAGSVEGRESRFVELRLNSASSPFNRFHVEVERDW